MSSDPSTSYSPLDDRDCILSPFSPASASETLQLTLCCDKFKIMNPKQFLYKNIFIILATYMFIPIIALHDDNKIGGITYASILIGIHVLFIIIYFYKVKFLKLDSNNKQLAARVLGLIFCVMLLGLVAGNLDEDLGMLALELMGLCAVHSMILLLVTVEVNGDGGIENGVIKTPIV
ncbi:hypothetical protein TL16_g07637 [Triparma laevis f. inornata]|uniref:Uncharacterized protein n=1 Tax=Triparma laevis f. inornata TaxID=1714386 RepID=A0A9W7ARU9_9STRA|nr:hypothetical protein TL16_g07637 [Triparma laevis f. inornata]